MGELIASLNSIIRDGCINDIASHMTWDDTEVSFEEYKSEATWFLDEVICKSYKGFLELNDLRRKQLAEAATYFYNQHCHEGKDDHWWRKSIEKFLKNKDEELNKAYKLAEDRKYMRKQIISLCEQRAIVYDYKMLDYIVLNANPNSTVDLIKVFDNYCRDNNIAF